MGEGCGEMESGEWGERERGESENERRDSGVSGGVGWRRGRW